MPSQTINVFVSYSHADAGLVAPVVRLLRVNQSLVFQDTDGITPGTKWRDVIAKALAESNLVVVFWCHHALRSNEVSSEWKAAIQQGKDLLPLLLDATPLPSELGAFQWIDFRGTVGANHLEETPGEILKQELRKPSPGHRPNRSVASRKRTLVWPAVVVGAASAAAILTVLWSFKNALPPPPTVNGWIYFLLAALLAAAGRFAVRASPKARRMPPFPAAPPSPSVEYPLHSHVVREVASQLEAEIVRRAATGRMWLHTGQPPNGRTTGRPAARL
jgi:hypothetical protein